MGSFHSEMMKGDAPPLTPGFVLETMKHHAVPWWLTTEDLPDPDNRVTLHNTTPLAVQNTQPGLGGPHPSGDTGHTNESEYVSDNAPYRIQLSYTPNNVQSFERLKDRWVDILKRAGPRHDVPAAARLFQKTHSHRRCWPPERNLPNGERSVVERSRSELQGP